MSSAQTFTPNERVLCYHGPLIYEAKVLKAETWDERTTQTGVVGAHYYVHYKGWKQTWDEWVDASRLLKFNETNIALQKALQSQKLERVNKVLGAMSVEDAESIVESLQLTGILSFADEGRIRDATADDPPLAE